VGIEWASRFSRWHEPDGSSAHRRASRRAATLCTLFCIASLLSAGSALGFTQRTHTFASSFGSAGEALGQLNDPGAVAVSESSGDVYVADRGNKRIDQFGPEGKPIAVWGFGVSDGEQAFEVCTSACKAGTGKGHGVAPGAIAVDNSAGPSKGDVYAVIDPRPKHALLRKFSPSGVELGTVRQEGTTLMWEGGLDGVAVDGGGNVWVYRAVSTESATVERFNGAPTNEFLSAMEATLESTELEERRENVASLCPKPGFAVDGAGEHVYADHERLNNEELCPEQVQIEEPKENRPKKGAPPLPAQFKFNGSEEFLGAQRAGLDSQSTAAVATDQSSSASTPLGEGAKGDVYLANGPTVTALDSSGGLIQHIELPSTAPQSGGVALEAKTGALYVADSANGQLDVFTPAESGKPIVEGVFPQNQTPTSTKLVAQIDPNGAATAYAVQYGTAACLSEPASCTTVHGASELPAVFGDLRVEVELTGLHPDTTYYYRVIAENEHGKVETARAAQTFFTTLPSAEGLLPDHRQWQMVSPPRKGGPLAVPVVQSPAAVQASADGSAIAYGTPNSAPIGEPEGNRSIQDTQFCSRAVKPNGRLRTSRLRTTRAKGLSAKKRPSINCSRRTSHWRSSSPKPSALSRWNRHRCRRLWLESNAKRRSTCAPIHRSRPARPRKGSLKPPPRTADS